MRPKIRTTGAERLRNDVSSALADPLFAEALFDRMPDVVFFVKNTLGQYVSVNEALVARCGLRSKQELIGRSPVEVFPAPLGASYAEQDRLVLTERVAIRDRLELHLYGDRTRGWCLTVKVPLEGRTGEVVGMAGYSRDLHRPDEGRAGYRGIAGAVVYLQEHVDEPLKIEDLARVAGMPAARFGRLVKRIFQITPGQLIIKTRVDRAAQLLHDTDGTVAEVAYACGYSDHSAFTRQFRSATGLTPTQFRELGAGRGRRVEEL